MGRLFNTFYNERLPFPLTGAQKRVIREIRQDTVTGHQMNRLLQGDVGSGQDARRIDEHVAGLRQRLSGLPDGSDGDSRVAALCVDRADDRGIGLRVGLLTGSTKKKERRGNSSEGLLSGRDRHT